MAAAAEAQERDDGGAEQGGDAAPIQIRKPKVRKSEALWLASFSDLCLLLMSFFVLQLAFSTPDKRKYDQVASVIQKRPQNLEAIEQQLKATIKKRKLDAMAEVRSDVNGVVLEFKDQIVFAPGSARTNPKYQKVVDGVMDLIAKTPGDYKLVIEGHTDDVPMRGGAFKSNWDLSASRGISLLESFKRRGVPESRVSVVAYAQTRPKVPVQGLTGDELKKARAANRRVVIRIE